MSRHEWEPEQVSPREPSGSCPECGRRITLGLSGWWTHAGLPGDCWRMSMDGPADVPVSLLCAVALTAEFTI